MATERFDSRAPPPLPNCENVKRLKSGRPRIRGLGRALPSTTRLSSVTALGRGGTGSHLVTVLND